MKLQTERKKYKRNVVTPGMKFDRWTVLQMGSPYVFPDGKETLRWTCICECGVQKDISTHRLVSGKCKSCGCFSRENTSKRSRKEPGESGFNQLYLSYQKGAVARGLSFNLTKEAFKKLTKEQCFYCGTKPSKTFYVKSAKTHAGREHGKYVYNGIDRWMNSVGYEPDNVKPCCTTCNFLKRDWDGPEFLVFVISIFNTRFGRK